MKILDRALKTVGLRRIGANSGSGFRGGTQTRLTADWAVSIVSNHQKLRASLKAMRSRSRDLADGNEYFARFLNKAKQNVIGPNGVNLQMAFTEAQLGSSATKVNNDLETAWLRWGDKASACRQMSLVDMAHLWMTTTLMDGECFTNRIRGYEFNQTRFALQFIDADQVDVQFNRLPMQFANGEAQNEIRLGVEVDKYLAPVAYWTFDRHPAEVPGVVRKRLSTDDVMHSFIFKLINQARGIPAPHAVMLTLNMIGGLEEAELVGARLGACKMAAFITDDGDGYDGEEDADGARQFDAEPGSIFSLAKGEDVKPIDWNHPNANFPEFLKSMLRGVGVGLDVSYSTLTGDLRDVNFSSIRTGILDEREGWRVLQTFAVRHFYKRIFADWLGMAILTGQVQIPSRLSVDQILENANWTPRGWDWVDPLKDVTADITAVRAGMSTLAAVASKRGRDWREDIDQRAAEIAYAKEKGVPIDLTTNGAGGVEGDTSQESNAGGSSKPNGKGALAAFENNHLVRLEQ